MTFKKKLISRATILYKKSGDKMEWLLEKAMTEWGRSLVFTLTLLPRLWKVEQSTIMPKTFVIMFRKMFDVVIPSLSVTFWSLKNCLSRSEGPVIVYPLSSVFSNFLLDTGENLYHSNYFIAVRPICFNVFSSSIMLRVFDMIRPMLTQTRLWAPCILKIHDIKSFFSLLWVFFNLNVNKI